MTRITHPLLAGLVAAALLAAAGCGDDQKSAESTGAAPSATGPAQSDDPATTTGEGENRATGPRTERTEPAEPSTPDGRRLGSELRDRLSGSGVTGVDVGRTTVTVRTKLDRDAASTASGICAQMRLFLAQEPSRTSTDTVTVLGGNRAVLTRC